MDIEEYKQWRKEQKKKLVLRKRVKPKRSISKKGREERKTSKYGIYPLGRRVGGSYGSRTGG